VKVVGDVEYLINRTANGWIVTMFNNKGVLKPQQGMAQVDRSAYVNVTITLAGQQIQSAVDWTTDSPLKVYGGNVSVRIPPGGLTVVELR